MHGKLELEASRKTERIVGEDRASILGWKWSTVGDFWFLAKIGAILEWDVLQLF